MLLCHRYSVSRCFVLQSVTRYFTPLLINNNLHRLFGFVIAINRAWSVKSGSIPCCLQKSRTAWQNFRRKNRKTQFWPPKFHFLEQDRLFFARDEISVAKFSKATSGNEKEKRPDFFGRNQIWTAVFNGEFSFFGRWKNKFGGGVGNFKTGCHAQTTTLLIFVAIACNFHEAPLLPFFLYRSTPKFLPLYLT